MTFQFYGSLFSIEQTDKYHTSMDLTFYQTITVTESYYPTFSFTKFFAELGGSIGLWLGMGLLQIGIYLVDLIANFRVQNPLKS